LPNPIASPPAPAKSSTLCIEKPLKLVPKLCSVRQLALPNVEGAPSESSEFDLVAKSLRRFASSFGNQNSGLDFGRRASVTDEKAY
jgi:hypothetical protein